MESGTIEIDVEKFNQLLQDVALMKAQLNEIVALKEVWEDCYVDDEGELTDWAKKELAEARKIPDSELISMEEIKKEFL